MNAFALDWRSVGGWGCWVCVVSAGGCSAAAGSDIF